MHPPSQTTLQTEADTLNALTRRSSSRHPVELNRLALLASCLANTAIGSGEQDDLDYWIEKIAALHIVACAGRTDY